MADPRLKEMLARREFVVAPGVFDGISARLADSLAPQALYVTGYGTVASALGEPDAGLATYTDMLSRIAMIVDKASVPVIADADTGYGGLLNVRHTVRGYEKAGVTAIQLEDQQFPKKCGHTPGRKVVPVEEMVDKIRVAVDSRRSEDFLVIARTDARTEHGLAAALDRGHAFAEAGADILFIESPESEAEMAEIGRSYAKPVLANMVEGGRTPVLPRARLAELGYGIAIFPAVGFLAMGAALRGAYSHLIETGSSVDTPVALHDFGAFSRLMGFEDVWAFDRKWAR
jgi:2-methylisocitrate lyase-like PEP mutase family enzyme